jgi:hypothetical protein
VSSTLLDPRVLDASTLIPKLTSDIFLPIGIEGQMDNAGTGVVGTPYAISRVDESATLFASTSTLHRVVSAVLNRGAGPVVAVASKKGSTPIVSERQAAWAVMESDETIRIRLTDSEVQADLAALAVSAANADLVYNKQVAIVGMPVTTTKANLIAAATAIAAGGLPAATRATLVGPGVYDENGSLRGGSFLAAVVAAEVAKNSDPGNDLDLWPLPLLTGIERDAAGLPIFRRKVVTGVAVDEYEDLLQGGVSPVQPSRVPGGVATTHLRTVYTTNGTYDALYTRIIVDQLFLDVKNYILDNNFLRAGNTVSTRARIKSGVEALLEERQSWVTRVTQADGSLGYNVSVTASADQRQITVGYEGTVVRGISTVKVAANLTIPV